MNQILDRFTMPPVPSIVQSDHDEQSFFFCGNLFLWIRRLKMTDQMWLQQGFRARPPGAEKDAVEWQSSSPHWRPSRASSAKQRTCGRSSRTGELFHSTCWLLNSFWRIKVVVRQLLPLAKSRSSHASRPSKTKKINRTRRVGVPTYQVGL